MIILFLEILLNVWFLKSNDGPLLTTRVPVKQSLPPPMPFWFVDDVDKDVEEEDNFYFRPQVKYSPKLSCVVSFIIIFLGNLILHSSYEFQLLPTKY